MLQEYVLYPNNVLPARVNQHVAIIRGNDKVDYRYLSVLSAIY